MKRGSSSVGENGFEPPEKRRKVRSCATCRRQKARCEFTTSTDTCHRCGVLGVACVFEGDAHANLLASHGTHQNVRQFSSAPRESAGATTIPPNGTVADKNIQNRLTTIEAALREVLKATGLPVLETFSQSLSSLKTHPAESPNGYQRQSSVASSSAPVEPSSPLEFTTGKGLGDPTGAMHGNSSAMKQFEPASMNPIDAGLITEAQGTELMAIFEMRYNHCLYTPILKSQRMTIKRPFTFTVMCVLALRHKSTISNQDFIRTGMNKLLQRHLSAAMSARPYTVDAIHGLLIMSLWSSVLTSRQAGDDLSGVPDGWLLLGTAVRMAQYLKLDTAAQRAGQIVREHGDKHPDYETVMEESRVWYTLVTHDIAMSLGSVRPRLINLTRPLDTTAVIGSFYTAPSDQCLAFHFDALFITSAIYNVQPPEDASQIPRFSADVEAVMDRLAGLANKAHEAGAMYLEDTSCSVEFRMFRLYHQYCGCVCLSHACGLLSSLPRGKNATENIGMLENGYENPEAIALLSSWMCRICQMAENVLIAAFPQNQREPFYFSTAPDHFFTTVAFCAAVLIQSQVTAAKHECEFDKAEEYDNLVEKAGEYFTNLVLPDAYLPRKYAEGLSSMLRRWRRKRHSLFLKKIIYSNEGIVEEKPNDPNRSNPSSVVRSVLSVNTSYPSSLGNAPAFDASPSASGDASKMPITPNSSDGLPCIDDAGAFLDPAIWLTEPTTMTTWEVPQPSNTSPIYPTSAVRWS